MNPICFFCKRAPSDSQCETCKRAVCIQCSGSGNHNCYPRRSVHFFVLVGLLWVWPLLSFGAFTPESESWRQEVERMVDLEGSNRTGSLLLKHGHEFRDVVRLLEIYPLSKKHELRKVQSDDPEASYQEAVEDFSSQASHRVIVYFDLMKFFLIASKVPGPLKRRALQSLRTRLIKSEGTMSLVECQIHLRLLELAIENKVLIVSDPLYLRLGELSAEGGRLSFRIQSDRRADCLEKKNCEMKQFRFLYEGLKQELFEAGNLSKEIVWWLKRMR